MLGQHLEGILLDLDHTLDRYKCRYMSQSLISLYCNRVFLSLKNALTDRPSLTSLSVDILHAVIPSIHSLQYLFLDTCFVKMSKLRESTQFTTLISAEHASGHLYQDLLSRCPGLLELNIEGSNAILNGALQHCPRLTALCCQNIDVKGVHAITASGIRLKQLGLTVTSLCDSILLPLIESQPLLVKLSLQSVTGYTDKTLIALSHQCSKLVSVVLGNRTITDIGISSLLQKCRLLRSIRLCECSSITVSALNTIERLGRDFTLKDVTRCSISEEESDEFLKRIIGKFKVVCLINGLK